MLSRVTNSPIILVVLQFIPILLIPPSVLNAMVILSVVEGLFLLAVVVGALRRKPWSQTLSIFVMGFNFITRLMMFFPHIVNAKGQPDWIFGLLMVVSISLSAWFLYVMDRPEITVRLSA
jgi:hypothetical protein